MSERLLEMVNRRLLDLGDNALSKLSVESGLSQSALIQVRKGHIPKPKNVKRLALACGCNEQEAIELALEAERAKEPA